MVCDREKPCMNIRTEKSMVMKNSRGNWLIKDTSYNNHIVNNVIILGN